MVKWYGCSTDNNPCPRQFTCRRVQEENDNRVKMWKMACQNYSLFMKMEEMNELDSSVREDGVGKDADQEHVEDEGLRTDRDLHDETEEER